MVICKSIGFHYSYLQYLIIFTNIFFCVAGWLLLSTFFCISLNFSSGFYMIVFSFIIFLSFVTTSITVMALVVNLYPVNYRALAAALILMCGRIGTVWGSYIIGILLNNNCSFIFYLFGGLLVGCTVVFMMIQIKSQ